MIIKVIKKSSYYKQSLAKKKSRGCFLMLKVSPLYEIMNVLKNNNKADQAAEHTPLYLHIYKFWNVLSAL